MRDVTLIRKNLTSKKGRLALLLMSLIVTFFLFGTLDTLQRSLSVVPSEDGGGRNVVSNRINYTQPLPVAYVEQIENLDGISRAAASTWFGGFYQEPRNFVVSYAVDIPKYLSLFPEYQLTSSARSTCASDGEALLVGKALAEQYGWAVGDRVSLFSSIHRHVSGGAAWTFRICGIYTDASQPGTEIAAFMPFEYLNNSRSFDADTTSLITFQPEEGVSPADLRRAVDAKFANSAFETATVPESQFAAAFIRQLGDIGTIVALVVGAALISMLMIVGSTMIVSVRERTREIAILKTLGYPPNRVIKLVLGEVVLVCAIGGGLGLLLANLVMTGVSSANGLAIFAPKPETWIFGLALIALVAAITGAIPAYRAFSVNVVEGLGRR